MTDTLNARSGGPEAASADTASRRPADGKEGVVHDLRGRLEPEASRGFDHARRLLDLESVATALTASLEAERARADTERTLLETVAERAEALTGRFQSVAGETRAELDALKAEITALRSVVLRRNEDRSPLVLELARQRDRLDALGDLRGELDRLRAEMTDTRDVVEAERAARRRSVEHVQALERRLQDADRAAERFINFYDSRPVRAMRSLYRAVSRIGP